MTMTWRAGSSALVAASLVMFSSGSPAGAARTVVRAVVSRSTVAVGGTVTVTVWIEGARDVGSVPFTLRYDPSVLELVASSAVEGRFLGRDGAGTSFLVDGRSRAREGSVVVGLSRLGGGRGARGRGPLCQFSFRARAPGVATISFSRAAVLDPAARPLAATFRHTSVRVKGVSR